VPREALATVAVVVVADRSAGWRGRMIFHHDTESIKDFGVNSIFIEISQQ
jgi:hypothetical protein